MSGIELDQLQRVRTSKSARSDRAEALPSRCVSTHGLTATRPRSAGEANRALQRFPARAASKCLCTCVERRDYKTTGVDLSVCMRRTEPCKTTGADLSVCVDNESNRFGSLACAGEKRQFCIHSRNVMTCRKCRDSRANLQTGRIRLLHHKSSTYCAVTLQWPNNRVMK